MTIREESLERAFCAAHCSGDIKREREVLKEIEEREMTRFYPNNPRCESSKETTKAVTRYARRHGFSVSTVRTCTSVRSAAYREWLEDHPNAKVPR